MRQLCAGGWPGAACGARIGASIGMYFGGVGVIPGSIMVVLSADSLELTVVVGQELHMLIYFMECNYEARNEW